MGHIAGYLQRMGKLSPICLLLGISLYAQSGLDPGPWPTLGHDNQRTNQSNLPGPSSPGAATILYDAGSPIGINQVVVTSDGKILMTSCTNKLVAINANGQPFGQAWPFTFMQTGDPGSPETPVGITVNNKGTIYASTHECPDIPGGVPAHFYSLQSDGTNTSNWPVSSHAMYWPAAVANDGTIFQMDEYAQISAYSPQGQTLWSVGTSGYGQGDIALDAAGNVYAGTDGNLYGGHTVYSFTRSGVLRTNWPQDTAGVSAPTTPVISPDGGIYIANNNGSLYAFNGDGSVRKGFPFNAGGTVSQQPLAVSNKGIVYIKTSLGLFAVNPDGTSRWSEPFSPGGDASISPGPILDSNGYIYVAFGNSVYSLNPDGTVRTGWPVTAPSPGTLIVGGIGNLYTVSAGQKLYSIANSSGASCSVQVPLLSQRDSQWSTTLYNSTSDTIGAVGCALTSLSMALNYAGLSTTPAALNSFLNNPNVAGYTDDGLIQWSIATDAASTSALSPFRLSPQVTLKFVPDVNDSVSNPQAAEAALSNALCGSKPHPVIVGVDFTQAENGQLVAGHFVLVTGKTTLPDQSVRFSIQDPYFNDDSNNNYGSSNTPAYTYLDQHGSHYRTTGYVIDPSGDFSRLSLNISGIVAMKLVDPLGRSTGFDPVSGSILSEIPQSGYWTDHLNNDSTGIVATGANTFIDVFQPQVGAYLVAQTALARGPYVLNLRSIAQDGTLQADNNVSGGVNRGSTATANIELQTIPGSSSSIAAIPGDINGDGIVNCTDLAIIKASFGKKVGQIGFDPRGDLNLDGIVDIRDLALVARYVSPGTECP